MELLLDFGFAWIAALLAVFLGLPWLARVIGRGKGRVAAVARRLNAAVRRHHKAIGVVLIVAGLVHGVFSSTSVLSLNAGTVLWVVSILLGLSWLLRRRLAGARGWRFAHRTLTLVFAALLAIHVVEAGGLQGLALLAEALRQDGATAQASSAAPALQQIPLADGTVEAVNASLGGVKLRDGTFTGEATGYHPGLAVSVKIASNRIVSVTVTSHHEVNSRFYARALLAVPAEIVEAQTTSVGIINAVNDALAKAVISGTLPADRALPQGGHSRGRFL
jgi:uncharacterized protein with FMN-binding domain